MSTFRVQPNIAGLLDTITGRGQIVGSSGSVTCGFAAGSLAFRKRVVILGVPPLGLY
jgi:hypothetical protein